MRSSSPSDSGAARSSADPRTRYGSARTSHRVLAPTQDQRHREQIEEDRARTGSRRYSR